MVNVFGVLVATILRLFRARRVLLLENLALRQQLAALKRRHPRTRLTIFDKVFWVLAGRFWSGWKQVLLVVTPETVVRWHRVGFGWCWRVISKVRKPVGRRPTSKEVRDLIFQMMAENPSWGAPRIHGELHMLGFDIPERTVSRWMKRMLPALSQKTLANSLVITWQRERANFPEVRLNVSGPCSWFLARRAVIARNRHYPIVSQFRSEDL